MNIITALKTENIRMTCGHAWLFWDDQSQMWCVYARPPYAKRNIVLFTGESLDEALEALIKG